MYDIIVVGAGPAGSTAAKVLSENGYKVLLAEKFKMPCYKSCSGQLIKKTLDLVQTYFGESVPASAMCIPTENKGMVFTDDKGESFCFEQEGLNVWRSSFDQWLADKAAQAITQNFDSVDLIYRQYRESTNALHNYMKRQWSFVAGMADTFKEMQLQI